MQETTCNAGDLGSIPGSESSTWRRKWQPTPVFLSGEFHGQKGLAGYSPFGQRSQTRLSDYTATTIQQCSLFSYFKGLENKMIQRKKFPLKEFPLYLLFPLPPYWIITELTRFSPWWQNNVKLWGRHLPPFQAEGKWFLVLILWVFSW